MRPSLKKNRRKKILVRVSPSETTTQAPPTPALEADLFESETETEKTEKTKEEAVKDLEEEEDEEDKKDLLLKEILLSAEGGSSSSTGDGELASASIAKRNDDEELKNESFFDRPQDYDPFEEMKE